MLRPWSNTVLYIKHQPFNDGKMHFIFTHLCCIFSFLKGHSTNVTWKSHHTSKGEYYSACENSCKVCCGSCRMLYEVWEEVASSGLKSAHFWQKACVKKFVVVKKMWTSWLLLLWFWSFFLKSASCKDVNIPACQIACHETPSPLTFPTSEKGATITPTLRSNWPHVWRCELSLNFSLKLFFSWIPYSCTIHWFSLLSMTESFLSYLWVWPFGTLAVDIIKGHFDLISRIPKHQLIIVFLLASSCLTIHFAEVM